MKFRIDENLPVEIAELLRRCNYDALTVVEQNLNGKDDTVIAKVCQDEQRVLITLDTDFSDIRHYPPDEYSGIIILRFQRQDRAHILKHFESILSILQTEQLEKRLWIFEEDRLRIRGEN